MKMFAVPNPLELRPAPLIGLGYLAGALTGGLVGAVWIAVPDRWYASEILAGVVFIGVACLIVQLVIASPILVLYRVFRWRYLNHWTAALIGLAIGAAPMLVMLSQPFPDGTSELLGYFSQSSLTSAGYWRLLRGAAWSGSIGLASAVTLTLFAVRHRLSESADC